MARLNELARCAGYMDAINGLPSRRLMQAPVNRAAYDLGHRDGETIRERNRPSTRKPGYGEIPGAARYEPETKTIRSVPGNHWLASMDSWDGAINHEATAEILAGAFEMRALLLEIAGLERDKDGDPMICAEACLIERAQAIVARVP